MTNANNWGRWGASDEYGSLNLVDALVTRAAVDLVREGSVISLAQPMGPAVGVPPHRSRASRFMNKDAGDYALGARSPGGFKFAEDTVLLSTHSGTHMDALAHVWSGDELYNGHPASAIRSNSGAALLGAEKLKPIVTRGILLDLVSLYGAPLPASYPVGRDDLMRAYAKGALSPERGDAVLLRTGWWEDKGAGTEYFDLEPGLSAEGASWLAEQEVAVVGADNYAVEVQPDPGGMTFPAHLELIHRHGVPLIENLNLTELARARATAFMFVLAPIGMHGSTAASVTPLAIL